MEPMQVGLLVLLTYVVYLHYQIGRIQNKAMHAAGQIASGITKKTMPLMASALSNELNVKIESMEKDIFAYMKQHTSITVPEAEEED